MPASEAPPAPTTAPATPPPSPAIAGVPPIPVPGGSQPKNDALPVPSTPPRPGSARERMRKETSVKYEGDTPPAGAPKPADSPPAADPAKPAAQTPPAKPAEEPAGSNEPPADLTPDQKKKNPWQLYRQEKERAAALEKKIAEASKASLAEQERTEFQGKIEKAEAKLKEYEDEIRFRAYEKSDEFKTKYEQPYEKAWDKAMHDLDGVTVIDDGGNQRPINAQDMLDLVNLSLPDARKLATEKWGDFAQDAMLARKEIRDLFEKKTQALDEAKKTGAEREKQFQEKRAQWVAETQKQIKTTWESANQEALAHPVNGEFFKPVEGDETRNQLLGKGFSLVDKAFSENPNDPKWTPEERAAIVRRHAAVRNRAAAFGPMKYLLAKLREQMAAQEKELAELRGSTPPAGGGTAAPSAGAPGGGSARDRMHSAGEKHAR